MRLNLQVGNWMRFRGLAVSGCGWAGKHSGDTWRGQAENTSFGFGLVWWAVFLALLLALEGRIFAGQERPNLLWITAEDICSNLGCYGDADAITPNLDRFASEGVRYENCFSVHPCCSPSRSALATGVYPTRLGTFQHRGKVRVNPEIVSCFPTLLRKAGYYTFNGSRGGKAKLDYNFQPKDRPWDKVGSKQIEWRNRAAGQPFFGQINLACTHQSQYGQRPPGGVAPAGAYSERSPKPTHDPAKLRVPDYLPDTPATRETLAEYHDRITQMDLQFNSLLKMLEADGLADNTIVFFFGDNGMGVPGGKIWLWDQGPHVPLIVRLPSRWLDMAPGKPGSANSQLVSFVDFAPTMLSLAGMDIPNYMQGRAFIGPKAGSPRQYVFAARDFHDGADFDTSRMVRDTRYHYIRNFRPFIGWDAIQYSWHKAPYMLEQWRESAKTGKLSNDTRQACFFRKTKPVEELYDVKADPWQMHNLSADPRHKQALEGMRKACEQWMVENHDLGLLSQYELYTRSAADSPLEMGADLKRNPIRELLNAADLADRRDPTLLPDLLHLLKSDDAAVRAWGVTGLLALHGHASPAGAELKKALQDKSPDVRLIAAEALCGLGDVEDALPVLETLLTHESRIIRNETLLAICRIGPAAKPLLPRLDAAAGPSEHDNIWSYDNIPEMIKLARACVADDPQSTVQLSRLRYIP